MQKTTNWKETLERLQEENERLRVLAQTDQLTGLYNRMTTQRAINQVLEGKQAGLLILMDIDDFKGCNDRFGHLNGDRILRKVAEVCRSFLLPGDIAGRVGGDEFVLFFPGDRVPGDPSETARTLERRFRQIHLTPSEGDLFLSVSLGIAYAGSGDDYLSLFRRADEALLDTKARKKNRISACCLAEGAGYPLLTDEADLLSNGKDRYEAPIADDRAHPYRLDYAGFLNLKQFLLRQHHKAASVHLLVLTLAVRPGCRLEPAQQRMAEQRMHNSIVSLLRGGDFYVRYSPKQYLLLLPSAEKDDVDRFGALLAKRFEAENPGDPAILHWEVSPLTDQHT